MENFLLKYMSQMLFLFSGIVFLVWLFQFIEIPYIECLQISFLKTYKYEGVISTFQMFTTIGAIFAFWYGYKKYEREKNFLNIQNYIGNNGNDELEKKILKWYGGYVLHKQGDLNQEIFMAIESSGIRYFITLILNPKNTESYVRYSISTIMYIFESDPQYLLSKLKSHKEFLQLNPVSDFDQIEKNKKIFYEEINKVERVYNSCNGA